MTKDFFRTAIFKNSNRNILLLKIRLPQLDEEDDAAKFSKAVNTFYRELCECYMNSAKESARIYAETLTDAYQYPVTFAVGWRRRDEEENQCELVAFLRSEKLYSRAQIIKSRETTDVFNKADGLLLK